MTTPDATTTRRRSPADWLRGEQSESVRRNLGLVAVLLALWAIGAWSRPDIFLDVQRLWGNELTVLTLASSIGVVAIGMTFVIISGGIDLSVGAVLALASVWSTTVATQGMGLGVMVFSALTVGVLTGLLNGILIAYGRMAPFIATLAMMVAARGLAQKISGKSTQVVKVTGINDLASTRVLGLPLLVLLFLLVAVLAWVLLNRTTFGRRAAAIGGNGEAARLAGISIGRTQLVIYALSGLCCGIAALMVTAQANAGSSDHGNLYELQAIAAVIIGGTALTGGRGTIVGSVLGVLVFTQITNLFIVNNLPIEYQLIAQGVIIVAAVLIQQFRVGSLRPRAGRPSVPPAAPPDPSASQAPITTSEKS
jgi:ribose transport system permease protein